MGIDRSYLAHTYTTYIHWAWTWIHTWYSTAQIQVQIQIQTHAHIHIHALHGERMRQWLGVHGVSKYFVMRRREGGLDWTGFCPGWAWVWNSANFVFVLVSFGFCCRGGRFSNFTSSWACGGTRAFGFFICIDWVRSCIAMSLSFLHCSVEGKIQEEDKVERLKTGSEERNSGTERERKGERIDGHGHYLTASYQEREASWTAVGGEKVKGTGQELCLSPAAAEVRAYSYSFCSFLISCVGLGQRHPGSGIRTCTWWLVGLLSLPGFYIIGRRLIHNGLLYSSSRLDAGLAGPGELFFCCVSIFSHRVYLPNDAIRRTFHAQLD